MREPVPKIPRDEKKIPPCIPPPRPNRNITFSHTDFALQSLHAIPTMKKSFHIAFALAVLTATTFAQSGAAFDKASSIRFPKIDLADATLEAAAAFLTKASRDLTPDKIGLNIVIKSAAPAQKKVTLRVTAMPGAEAVRYCAEAAGFSVTWSGDVAIFSDQKNVPSPTVAYDIGGRSSFARASKMIVPKVDFRDATMREVLEFLAAKSTSLSPGAQRLNIIFNSPPATRPAPGKQPTKPDEITIPGLEPTLSTTPAAPTSTDLLADRRLSFQLSNSSIAETLRIVALMSGATIRWDANAVLVGPAGSESRPQIVNTVAIKGKIIMEKLSALQLPKLDFRESKMNESCDFLVRKMKELDPEKKGLNVLTNGTASAEELILKIENAPALEVLRYMAELSGTDLRIEHHALVFQPK